MMAAMIDTALEPSPAASVSPTVGELQWRAAALLPRLREGSAARERDRVLPHAQVRGIIEQGLVNWRIPRTHGGAGASVQDVIRFVADVAAVDSNAAQALRPGFLFIEGLLAADDEAVRRRWFPRLLEGRMVGNAGWEIGGANGAVAARIVREGAHFRASGSKYYSTGALYADWVSTIALDEKGDEVRFVLPLGREGLELLDDFDAMGQRLTASGTTNLHRVRVDDEDIVPSPLYAGGARQRTIITPFAQLFLAAVEAGIARAALDDAVDFARNHARPIKHSSEQRSVDDPYVQFSVGEIAARAFAADAVVQRAAATIDAAWTADLDDESVIRAQVEVAQAQVVAAESALKASELLFDVGGASTTSRKHNLDRHWRNARTVANHNPRHWKSAIVGAHLLTGAAPPPSGLF
jgi:alkylation response protein AidB-like acyl-CoA dehydrogenase